MSQPPATRGCLNINLKFIAIKYYLKFSPSFALATSQTSSGHGQRAAKRTAQMCTSAMRRGQVHQDAAARTQLGHGPWRPYQASPGFACLRSCQVIVLSNVPNEQTSLSLDEAAKAGDLAMRRSWCGDHPFLGSSLQGSLLSLAR